MIEFWDTMWYTSSVTAGVVVGLLAGFGVATLGFWLLTVVVVALKAAVKWMGEVY